MFAFSYLLPLSNYLQSPVSCQVFIIHFTIKYSREAHKEIVFIVCDGIMRFC